MSDTGINAVHVTGKPAPREPGQRISGLGALISEVSVVGEPL